MEIIQVEKWDFFERTYIGPETGNPFLEVSFTADFTNGLQQFHIKGFYDGQGQYKQRFMPASEGNWQFITHSNIPELEGHTGEFQCVPPSPNNHGPVRVVDTIHFAYEDGTPYQPIGTTCYVWNHQSEELQEQTLRTLEESPFNKIRFCVFPKRYSFNANEPPSYPFPGEISKPWNAVQLYNYHTFVPLEYWDFSRFNPEYFQRLERRVLDLRKLGIEADLILFHPYDYGAWGFDSLDPEVNDRYLAYLAARLSAYRNVWWSFANEYDVMPNRTMAEWDHFFQVVEQEDPYGHLRSIHNCGPFYDHTKPWVTHCSVQHQNPNMTTAWLQKYQKPVVVDECGYEGDICMLWGDLSPEEMVLRHWMGFASGGYVGHGETYIHDKDILWWSKGGELHGESAQRIAFLRKIMAEVPGKGLYPLKIVESSEGPVGNPLFSLKPEEKNILAGGTWNVESAGHVGTDFFLLYYGMHQPSLRHVQLPEGNYRIDLLDTWNMTIETFAESAAGKIDVVLPRRKFMAIRIQRTNN